MCRLLVGCLIVLGCFESAVAQTATFADDFDRPDGPVANGWTDTTGNLNGDLLIRSGALSTPGPGGDQSAGVYRPVNVAGSVTVSATLTHGNGFGGLLNRYNIAFVFGSDGSLSSSGHRIAFFRGDQNFPSFVNVNGIELPSSFQFGASISTTFTINPDGSVSGSVSGDGNTFEFTSGSSPAPIPGANFAIILGFPDTRSTVITNPTVDDVSITEEADGFLGFPLPNKTPYTAKINSVFDHSAEAQYCDDGIVIAYTGEQGRAEFGLTSSSARFRDCDNDHVKEPLHGFKSETGTAFVVNGQYAGGGEPTFLSYDGHPGYDYRTIDQRIDGSLCPNAAPCSGGSIPVLAAAGGVVTCARTHSCPEGPGAVKIDHGNGYLTVYLHLGRIDVSEGATVLEAQSIGLSGAVGAQGNPHLHFEVRRVMGQETIPVDPYGWSGQAGDPYTRSSNKVLWK